MDNIVISISYPRSKQYPRKYSALFRKRFNQMRTKFDPQLTFGSKLIEDIEFDVFCRHEMIPILMAIQYLYVERRQTLFKICDLIRKDIASPNNSKLGCKGMNYWEILILAALRLGCDLNFDQLSDLATNHLKIREMMMLSIFDDKRYPKSTINDNLTALSNQTIQAISNIIVDEGHRFEPTAIARVRGDSYVMKKNIHYPTDSNLLVDANRKITQLSARLAALCQIPGWRKHDYLYQKARKIKRKMEKVARSRKKDKDDRLKGLYTVLVEHSEKIVDRSLLTIHQVQRYKKDAAPAIGIKAESIENELQFFIAGAEYVSELIRRRVFNDEKIPNADKVFSIFETTTELINRGKSPNPIEFGHRVLIIQDRAGFIIHCKMMGIGVTDEKIIVEVMENLQKRFNGKIHAASFDKGFWTPDNLKRLSSFIPLVVLPKKGKRSRADKEREGAKEFGIVRKWHAGVESAINALGAGNGLALCRDKGHEGYERYLALGVLGRNLQTLGTILLEKERKRKREQMLMQCIA